MVTATLCGLRKRLCLPPPRTKFLTDSDRRGSAFPGQDASLLIDSAGFTLYSLVLRAAAASPDAAGS